MEKIPEAENFKPKKYTLSGSLTTNEKIKERKLKRPHTSIAYAIIFSYFDICKNLNRRKIIMKVMSGTKNLSAKKEAIKQKNDMPPKNII